MELKKNSDVNLEKFKMLFVLSGFVMLVSHYKRENENLRDYYVSRIARIGPVYMLALALSCIFYFTHTNNNFTAFILNATFLQSWFPPHALTWNGPAWSLSVEAFFYLTFPLVLISIKNSQISCKNFAILAFVFYCFTQVMLSNLMTSGFYSGFS